MANSLNGSSQFTRSGERIRFPGQKNASRHPGNFAESSCPPPPSSLGATLSCRPRKTLLRAAVRCGTARCWWVAATPSDSPALAVVEAASPLGCGVPWWAYLGMWIGVPHALAALAARSAAAVARLCPAVHGHLARRSGSSCAWLDPDRPASTAGCYSKGIGSSHDDRTLSRLEVST